jgi:Domain of unknown function (DUF3854)
MISTASKPLQVVDFEGFQSKIKREFIAGSAISPKLFEAAIGLIEDTGYWEPQQALGWKVSTQWQTRKPHDFGTLAGFFNEDGSLWQAKPQNPRVGDKGKPQKYETPVGNGSRGYLPPVNREIRRLIARRYSLKMPSSSESFWDWVESHPEIPIVVTEGGKKSLALINQGYVAIALYGCNAGVKKWETIAGEKVRRLKSELIGDLKRFAHPDRQWSIALDQDSDLKTHHKVQGAIGDLAFHLEQSGGKVSVIQWHGQNGRCKGVDDLIVNASVKAWEKALEEAVPAPEWRISRKLARAVRRMPDLHIGTKEFKEVAATLPTRGLIALYGGKGTAKSEAIALMVKLLPWLSLTALRSVGRDQAAGFGGVFVNDGDRYGTRLLDENGNPANGGSVCIPSLLKVQRVAADVLILDETTAIAEFLLISKLSNKDGIRSLLLAEFIRRVREAKLVILADADLTEEAIQWIESIRGERCYLVRSDRKALTYQAFVIDGKKNDAIAMLQTRAATTEGDEKLIYINCDEKGLTEALADLLGRNQCLLINSDTSGEAIQSAFLTSKGRDTLKLIKMGYRFVISSPSVCQGFSINHCTELIDSVWGFYSGHSIAAHQIAQSPDRVRDNIPRFLWIAKKGSAYSNLSKAQSTGAFLKEFEQLNTTAARLVRHSLTPDAIAQSDAIDWQGANLKMLASLEVRRNQGMADLRTTLIALLKHEGKQVEIINPTCTKGQSKEAGKAIKEAGKAIKEAHYAAVASAESLTSEEAKHLSENPEKLTPEQVLSLEKFYIAEFYRLEEVAIADAEFDRDSKTRDQIRHLEMVVNPEIAIDRTAGSINRSPDCPQDWDKSAVRSWLIEKSGAGDLIRSIYSNEIKGYTLSDIAAIADFCNAHSKEFRIAGFSNISEVKPMQAIGVLLDWVGIKRKRHQTTVDGVRVASYEIDKPHLEKLSAIIDRRAKACTAPPNEEVNKGGVQPESVANIAHWLTPECLADMRENWALADSDEVRAELRKVYPIEALRRAIAA